MNPEAVTTAGVINEKYGITDKAFAADPSVSVCSFNFFAAVTGVQRSSCSCGEGGGSGAGMLAAFFSRTGTHLFPRQSDHEQKTQEIRKPFFSNGSPGSLLDKLEGYAATN